MSESVDQLLSPLPTDIRGRFNPETMDQTTPEGRKRYLLLAGARRDARSLPEDKGLFFGFMGSFLAVQRGDGLSAEDFVTAFEGRVAEMKSRMERRARELRMTTDELSESVGAGNVQYLLVRNSRMMLHEALYCVLDAADGSVVLLAPSDELKAAMREVYADSISWARRLGLPFSLRRPITIPTTTLVALLKPIIGMPDAFVGEGIPRDKLVNAVEAVGIPWNEAISALIDCTFWGSAKNCVLIGSKAIYFRNEGADGFLPYSEFPDITFYPQENSVYCGDVAVISLAGSGFQAGPLVSLLDAIKREAIKREASTTSGDHEGLVALPGMNELKQMLIEEVVEPLRNPEQFRKYKIEIPNGILMYGPPGCGKTFIAQKLAAELDYNYHEISPSEVGSTYIHGSALKIRQLFDEAAAHAPAVMFVDEFEGMVPSRRDLTGTEQYKSEEVSEWLVQIANCANRRILFVAATNEPWKIDEAVQRSGRLDKKVYVGPPDEAAIGEMLLYHLKGRPHSSPGTVREFAATIAGQGYSSSDVKLMVDEAAKLAMKDRSDISPKHLTAAAMERVRPSIPTESETSYQQFYARQ